VIILEIIFANLKMYRRNSDEKADENNRN